VLAGFVTILPALTLLLMAPERSSYADATNLGSRERMEIIDSITARLMNEYVFEDVANQMASLLRQRANDGVYDGHVSLAALLQQLNEDLQAINPDQHLRLQPLEGEYEPSPDEGEMSDQERQMWESFSRFVNHGVHGVSRLEGNIGYFDVRFWPWAEFGFEPVAAAMALLSEADAIIIDVRRHMGGRFEVPQFLLGYFFDKPAHIVTTVDRLEGTHREQWTSGILPGEPMADVPLYVLTSWETASGGELLPFVLKNLGRATIVGEKTRGAGHRTHRSVIADLGIDMHIPHAADIDPANGASWDGIGVAPDVDVPAKDALLTAQVLALEYLLEHDNDALPNARVEREWALRLHKGALHAPILSVSELEAYAGQYGERNIRVQDGNLYYQKEGDPSRRLVPLGDDWFMFGSEELYYIHVRFEREDSGRVIRLVMSYDSGQENSYERN
jgi:hypothetical protein